jgi:hemin uptake protein HemP
MMPESPATRAATAKPVGAPARAGGGTPQTLESRQLLGNAREVLIRHGAETYRLRQTQAGKLILTK